MIQEHRHTVPRSLDGQRVDIGVATLCGMTRGQARRLVDLGGVWVDGHRVRVQSRALRAGQVLEVLVADPPEPPTPDLAPSALLFRHRSLVAVDKPAGVYSQAARHRVAGTLPDLVARLLGQGDPEPVHRLDRQTSGIVVLGLDRVTCSRTSRYFARGEVRKGYLALVALAAPLPDVGSWDEPLGPDPRRPGGVCVRSDGDASLTEYRVLGRAVERALLAVFPRTGRMHQIRVHCAHHGAPVLGDGRYGPPDAAPRMGLHGAFLRLPRPVVGAVKDLEAPVPQDLRQACLESGLGGALGGLDWAGMVGDLGRGGR